MISTESIDSEIKRYRKRTIASFQLGNLVGLMFSQIIYTGAFLFWKFYKLTDKEIKEITIKLQELDL